MKKLILSLVLLIGLSFNANAGPTAAGLAIQPWVVPVVVLIVAAQEEYRSCSDDKMLEGRFSDGKSNHLFSIEPCEYLDNPSKYTWKSS